MADGTYERRGPREAELKRLQRILAEQAKKREETIVPGVKRQDCHLYRQSVSGA